MMRVLPGFLVPVLLVVAVTGATAQYQYPAPPPPPAQPAQPAPGGLSAAKAQAKIAAVHAGYAAAGGTVSYAREHVGHALACIEGAKGKNVNAAWENPCQGMGNGVLPDLQRAKAGASLIAKAKDADAAAVAALKSTDLTKLKGAAKQVSTLMQQIAQAK